MNHAESQIQISIAGYLAVALKGLPATFFAVPNGGKRASKVDRDGRRYSPEAGRMRAEGVRAGVADIIVMTGEPLRSLKIGLEVKAPKGVVSKDQKEWRTDFERAGGIYFVVRSIDDVAEALVKVGVPIRARPSTRPGCLYDVT